MKARGRADASTSELGRRRGAEARHRYADRIADEAHSPLFRMWASEIEVEYAAGIGDWDRAVGTNTPGQSGDPSNPHYQDLFAMWANDRYFPVPYSRARVEAAAEKRWVLSPPR